MLVVKSTIGKTVTFSRTKSACILNDTFFTTVNNAFIYDGKGCPTLCFELNVSPALRFRIRCLVFRWLRSALRRTLSTLVPHLHILSHVLVFQRNRVTGQTDGQTGRLCNARALRWQNKAPKGIL